MSEATEDPVAPSAGDKSASTGEAVGEQVTPEPEIQEPVVGMTLIAGPKSDEIKTQGVPSVLKTILEKMAAGKPLDQGEQDYLAKVEAQQLADPVSAKAVRRLELTDDSNVQVRSIKEIVNLPPRLLNNEEKKSRSSTMTR